MDEEDKFLECEGEVASGRLLVDPPPPPKLCVEVLEGLLLCPRDRFREWELGLFCCRDGLLVTLNDGESGRSKLTADSLS